MAQPPIRLDSREVQRALRDLWRNGTPRIVKTALEKTTFEIKAAEQVEIAGAFRFSSPNTQRFLSTSVRFDPVRLGDTQTTIGPLEKSANILIAHEKPSTITANDDRLALGGVLAVPVTAKRGASGKVPAAEGPGRLLQRFGARKARGKRQRKAGRFVFVSRSGRALVEAMSGRLRVLYALVPSARLRDRLNFAETAERTAKRELPRKVQEAFEKEARRSAARR
jgi:hypothetical protein